MSKKLICLILALVMLLGIALTSCSKNNEDEQQSNITEKASESAMTLSMYLMTKNELSKETKDEITKAITAITEERLSTRLVVYFYTEDEYYAALDKAFDDRKKADASGNYTKIEGIVNDDPTIDKESGRIEIKYPQIANYQVDIFYLGGKDNYDKYKDAGLLSNIGGEISAPIYTNIYGQYITGMEAVNGDVYALPTNGVIGEYTYLLLNKEAMEKAYRRNASGVNDYSKYTSITCEDVQDFLSFVADSDEIFGEYDKIYTNMSEEELLINNLQYWGVDENGELSDEFSVLGGYYSDSYNFLDADKYAKIENLFENEQFVSDLTTLKLYDANGYIHYAQKDETYDKDFAVGYVKGGAELAKEYGDEYEMIVLEAPRLDEETLYKDMFAVSTQTSAVDRSMDVVTLFNTDETLRNLLLYGIEGEHYQLVDTEIDDAYGERIMAVQRFEKSSEYQMDIEKTGNIFIAYPEEDDPLDLKDYMTKQNRDAKIKLDFGFKADGADAEKLANIKTLSDEILADYLALEVDVNGNGEEIAAFIEEAKAKVSASEDVAYHLDSENSDSLSAVYNEWLIDNKIIKKK